MCRVARQLPINPKKMWNTDLAKSIPFEEHTIAILFNNKLDRKLPFTGGSWSSILGVFVSLRSKSASLTSRRVGGPHRSCSLIQMSFACRHFNYFLIIFIFYKKNRAKKSYLQSTLTAWVFKKPTLTNHIRSSLSTTIFITLCWLLFYFMVSVKQHVPLKWPT